MRLLHVIQRPQLRGAEISTAQLCTHLENQGDEVLLVSLFKGSAQLPFNGRTIHLNANFRDRFWSFKKWYMFWRIIKAEKPDIIQANSGFTLKFVLFSKLFFRWRQPVIFRNASTISLYIHNRYSRLWNWLFLRNVAAVASVSAIGAADLVRLFPKLGDRTVVIPTGIEAVKENVREEKSAGEFTLLHVGGFTFEKNHEGLIQIFAKVREKIPHARLILAGDGPLRTRIEQLCRSLGIEQSVQFMGFTSDVPSLLRKADVMLLTSIIEGLPASILEAFYFRLPVIAYDTGGISELVIDRETGRLITLHDEESFISAITEIYAGDGTEEWIENAYQKVVSRYLNSSVAAGFSRMYTGLAAAAGAGFTGLAGLTGFAGLK